MNAPTEAEIRRLALEVRRHWRGLTVIVPLGFLSPAERAEADRRTAEYREAVRLLTVALLAYPKAVQLDAETMLLPNADGDGPAFCPDPKQVDDRAQRGFWRNTLGSLLEAHRRRHAPATPARRRA